MDEIVFDSGALDGTCNSFALRKASRHLTALYDRQLSSVGIRATQFTILQKLKSKSDLSIRTLAELMGMDRTTLSANLKPLVRDGLVDVVGSAADRRRKVVTITAAGEALFARALPLWQKAQQQFESDFGVSRAAELRALSRAVVDVAPRH